MKQNYVAAN
jgi:hypothetical protein